MLKIAREPAQLLALVRAGLVLLAATVLPLSEGQQGAIVAVLAAVCGVITAAAVKAEKAAPLVAGLVEAVLALALAFGATIEVGTQAAIMAFVAAGIGFYLRTQVAAKVPDAPQGVRGVAA